MSICAESLTVHRNGREVLSNVSIRIDPGEVIALVGPNGAGKSTLLSAMTGALHPSNGRALLNGVELADITSTRQAELRAVMRQSFSLPFPFSVTEVVEMGLLTHRNTRAMHQALEWADLIPLADRPITQLSGGERQRVSLAKALAQLLSSPEMKAPKFLLLDEPTASLDLKHQKLVMDACREVGQMGCGVVVVLHDLNLAARYADRIAVLCQGELSGFDSPQDVLTKDHVDRVYGTPVYVADFQGVPAITLA